MRFLNRLTVLIVIGVCITTSLPILAAITLARSEAMERQEELLTETARRALVRSESTAGQLAKVASVIGAMTEADACSPQGLDALRRLDLSSTLLQAVGVMDGNVMRCSSLGGTRQFNLGPPDMTSINGVDFRTNVRLFDPSISYLSVSADAAVGIIHKDLVLSFVDEMPGLRVGVFSWSQHKLLLVRGAVDPGWMRPDLNSDTVFRSGSLLVAIVRSDRSDIGAVAALPIAHATGYVGEFAMVLVPIGALVGLLLSAVLIYVVRTRISMPTMIRTALKRGKFHLLYQPVVELETGRIKGVEALIRWSRGKDEPILPDVFIPVAEQAGLIPLITSRVLELLAEDARFILNVAPDFKFSVNFSAQDMHRTNILEEVNRLIEHSGLGFENLVIEATERSLVDVDVASITMRQLRNAGVKVAIDDFGTGYSSLAYLAQLEVDYLKIDRLFVQSLGTDSATNQVAERIIEMAKDLKLEIVAEGIETRQQEEMLKRLNVEYAQGYLFGHPMTLDELLPILRTQKQMGRPKAKIPTA